MKMPKKAFSLLLAAILCTGTLPVMTAADGNSALDSVDLTLPQTAAFPEQLLETEKSIISEAVASLLENGNTSDVLSPDEDLVEAFADLGLDFYVVKTYVADSIISERTNGVIDVSMYPADKATMRDLMEYITLERHLQNSISWEFSTDDGSVTAIEYTLSEGYSMVLDELDGTSTPVTGTQVAAGALNDIGAIELDVNLAAEPAVIAEEDLEIIEDSADEEVSTPEDAGCAHKADAETVIFHWGTTVTAKDYDNDGNINVLDSTTGALVELNDQDDFILTYDSETGEYTAVPATSTVYYVMGATYTCTECEETVTGYFGYDSALNYGYYVIMDAATIGAGILDGFIGQGLPISYDANDPATIATGLEQAIQMMEYTYGMPIQNMLINDLGFYHILVASETDYAIAQSLNYLGNCGIEQVTAENYYDLYMGMYSTMFYAEYTDADGNVIAREEKNATVIDLDKSYGAFSNYYYENPEYFGFATDYWLSKETTATPLGAMKVMCSYGVADLVPTYYLNYMAEMLGQALMAYSYYTGFGDALVAVRDEAIALIDSMGNASQAQQLLAIHDYLANLANYDMASISKMIADPTFATSPLGMLPYSCLLTGYTGMAGADGSLCLGYAAAYTYLVQWAVMGVDEDGNLNKDGVNVDFQQIRYHTDIVDASVAGNKSGFVSEDAESSIFNLPHYINAVYLSDTGYWYSVDVCYDDINTETISQMRVETDGNISHAYFLLSSATMQAMIEGSYDYIDSLHDGLTYYRATMNDLGTNVNSPMNYDLSAMYPNGEQDAAGNYIILNNGVDEGWYISVADGLVYDADGCVVYLYEESDETVYGDYNDDSFEDAWFTYASSQILWDDNYFYYILDQDANLAEMLSMNAELEEYDNMDMEQLLALQSENKTENADRLVRRARYDMWGRLNPDKAENHDFDFSNFFLSNIDFYVENDKYTETLFHFGLATAIPNNLNQAEAYAQMCAGFTSLNFRNNSFESNTSDESYKQWMTEDEFLLYVLEKDQYYLDNYPDIKHTLGLIDGKLYFNFANQIFSYDISAQNRHESNLACVTATVELTEKANNGWFWNIGNQDTVDAEAIYADSEYYTVDAYQTDREFIGMSFFTYGGDYAFTVEDHPISGLAIYNKVVWYDPGSDVDFAPTAVVSIGTNYAKSYQNYAEEVPTGVYDPTYNMYVNKDDEKKNTEFMWCANVVDIFDATDLSLSSHTHEFDEGVVTLEPTCTVPGEMLYTCYCDYTYTEEIPTIAHTYENGYCTVCDSEVVFDETITLGVGETYTITVNDLNAALTEDDIAIYLDGVVSVSVTSSCNTNNSWVNWWSNCFATYTGTITLTGEAEGICYITVNGTVYKVIVCAHECGDDGLCTKECGAFLESFDAELSETSVTVGDSVTLTVTTSTNVAYVTVNGEKVEDYDDDGDTRTFVYTFTADTAGTYTYTVTVYNEDDIPTNDSQTLTLTVNKKSICSWGNWGRG